MENEINKNKQQLREEMLGKRRNLSLEHVKQHSELICTELLKHPNVQKSKHIASYVTFDNEVDLMPVMETFLQEGKDIYLPRFEQSSGQYLFVKIHSLKQDLIRGKYGIFEPKDTLPSLLQRELKKLIDLWLVPGVAFDHSGHRLGRGKAIYDQLLSEASGFKIGIGYPFQIISSTLLPFEKHDIVMDWIIPLP